jgi:hypothetical protein
VSLCIASVCRTVTDLNGAQGTPQLAISSSFATDATAFAWNGDQLYRSSDGGDSFARVALPIDSQVQTITDDGAGTFYLALGTVSLDASTGGLFVSRDGGATWSRLGAGTSLDKGVSAIAVRGRDLVAAPASPDTGGLLRSSDGGRSWREAEPTVTNSGAS